MNRKPVDKFVFIKKKDRNDLLFVQFVCLNLWKNKDIEYEEL